MIRNLAFDIGNVLVDWDPKPYLMQTLSCDAAEAARIAKLVFDSAVWKQGDLGLGRDVICTRLCEEYPQDAAAIRAALADCNSVLREFPETTAMLEKLKSAGFGIYFISNTNLSAVEHIRRTCRFFSLLDGGIASFREQVLKPSADIYRLFLSRYGITAAECLFVDDLEENVCGAAACGLVARQLTAPSGMRALLCEFPELRTVLDKTPEA